MGKKYIIELEEPEMFDERKYYQCSQMPWWSMSENIVENLTLYTEPDMEQIRKEAYEKGYENGFVAGHLKAEKSGQSFYEDGYQRGMADANRDGEYNADDGWYVMQKISLLPNLIKTELFGTAETAVILQDNSFKDALDKLTEYEQEKEEQSFTAEEVMRQYLDTFCKNKSCIGCPLYTPDFTCGRGYHFLTNPVSDEEVRKAYAEVLQKMGEK